MLDFSVNLMICWHRLRNPTLKIDELTRFRSIISSYTQKGHVKEREGNRLILVVPFFVRMNLYKLPMPHAPPPSPAPQISNDKPQKKVWRQTNPRSPGCTLKSKKRIKHIQIIDHNKIETSKNRKDAQQTKT